MGFNSAFKGLIIALKRMCASTVLNAVNGTMNQGLFLTILRSLLEAAREEDPEIGGNTGGFFTTTTLSPCDSFPKLKVGL
jgi:hypothetical protein